MPCRMKRSNAPEPDFSPRIKHDAERRGEGLRMVQWQYGHLTLTSQSRVRFYGS
jgi:hypothetical protein